MTNSPLYLIDDEPAMLELYQDVAKLAGLHAQGYTRADQFFAEVMEPEAGSIMVLDLHMPEIDGVEVMRHLATMARSPALILISGHDPGVLHAAEQLGQAHGLEILACLGKPVPMEQFRQILEQHASGSRAKRQKDQVPIETDLTVAELRQAIRDEQMILHYQPQLEIASGRITGVEALVRWQHPEQGLIYPGRFIHLAEQHRLIGELTYWLINKVMEQSRQWQDLGLRMAVSINVSATDVTSVTLPEQLAQLLAENKLDPTMLTLEVTESVLMGELVTSLDILTRLRLKGIGLAIDDFGTGYSSLSQLHRVPFTDLKIDRSFVSNMAKDSEARAITKTCILLSHELNMRVIAEGVEDQATWDLLAELGCDLVQGYFIARPMPASDLPGWAKARA